MSDPGVLFFRPEIQMFDPGPEDRMGVMVRLARAFDNRCDDDCMVWSSGGWWSGEEGVEGGWGGCRMLWVCTGVVVFLCDCVFSLFPILLIVMVLSPYVFLPYVVCFQLHACSPIHSPPLYAHTSTYIHP